MQRKIIVVAVVALAGFVLASSAAASNWPSGRLDTAASAVAGHLGGSQVGSYHSSIALLTLAHEGVHQRGIGDEGVADCTALPLVPGLAANYFGVPRTIARTKIVNYTKTVVRRVNGKSVRMRVRAQKAVRFSIANPFLGKLAADARAWHRAAPPQYQGTC
jgi:hypothetical protein